MPDLHSHPYSEAHHLRRVEKTPAHSEQSVPPANNKNLFLRPKLRVHTDNMFRENIPSLPDELLNIRHHSNPEPRRLEQFLQPSSTLNRQREKPIFGSQRCEQF